jgi:hypothetical protein
MHTLLDRLRVVKDDSLKSAKKLANEGSLAHVLTCYAIYPPFCRICNVRIATFNKCKSVSTIIMDGLVCTLGEKTSK